MKKTTAPKCNGAKSYNCGMACISHKKMCRKALSGQSTEVKIANTLVKAIESTPLVIKLNGDNEGLSMMAPSKYSNILTEKLPAKDLSNNEIFAARGKDATDAPMPFKIIGQGMYGVVYQATDGKLYKEMRTSGYTRSSGIKISAQMVADAIDREIALQSEAAAAGLAPQIFAHGKAGNNRWIEMQDLSKTHYVGMPQNKNVSDLEKELLEKTGISHNDLHIGNIMVDKNNPQKYYIIDYGYATKNGLDRIY